MHAIIVRTTVPMLLVLTLALSFAGEPPTPHRYNQIGGKDIVYDLSGQTGSAPVTVEAERI